MIRNLEVFKVKILTLIRASNLPYPDFSFGYQIENFGSTQVSNQSSETASHLTTHRNVLQRSVMYNVM